MRLGGGLNGYRRQRFNAIPGGGGNGSVMRDIGKYNRG